MYRVEIETENAAFGSGSVQTSQEVARILHALADRLELTGELVDKRLMDYNGNAVGSAEEV